MQPGTTTGTPLPRVSDTYGELFEPEDWCPLKRLAICRLGLISIWAQLDTRH